MKTKAPLFLGLLLLVVFPAAGQQAVTVDGSVALNALMSLCDNHLKEFADDLKLFATTEAARSTKWDRLRGPLVELAAVNVPAVVWFALPDGSYWTIDQGKVDASVADRPYFKRVLAGETVIGELVVSRSTGRNVAVLATPVYGRSHKVVGVVGASVYLDRLSVRLRKELGDPGANYLFYAVDKEPLGAIHSDPDLIFAKPMEIGDDAMKKAFQEMLASESGTLTYPLRDRKRTIVYRKSPVTGWWYAFGVLQ